MSDVESMKELIRQRLTEIRERAVANPWMLVGFGVLAGVWLASHHKREREVGAIAAVLGALGLRFIRDAAMLQMANIARSWVSGPEPEYEQQAPYHH